MVNVAATLFDLAQRRSLLPGPVENAVTGPGRDVSGLTVLVTGASAGIGREAVRALTARGAHLIAVARRSDELRSLAAETGCAPVVKLLLDAGADFEAADVEGRTPLWIAAHNGREDVVRLLLERDVGLEARDVNGCTALQTAAYQNRYAIERLLVARGAEEADCYGLQSLF